MKLIAPFLILLVLSSLLLGQDAQKPEWVRLVQQGKTLADSVEYYFGIGSSSLSQEDADARARQDFGLNIESHVQSTISHSVQETNDALKDEYSTSAKVSSDVVLRGVSITSRYEDRYVSRFYALIQIQKSVFDTLLTLEIKRDLERRKSENRTLEEKREEELRSRQADLDLRRKEEETRRQEIELEQKQYEDFLRLTPPEQVIDLRNGEIARKACTLALKTALSPFDIQSAYVILAAWRFEFSMFAYLQTDKALKSDDPLRREQAAFKIQLLDQSGRLYKTSLAFGVIAYASASRFSAFDSIKPGYSMFVGGDVGLPTFLNSFASVYVDGRKISGGINWFPVPGYLKDAVSVLLQVDYVWNKNWRNRFSDPLLFQAGVRFRASDAFSTSFSYEEHEYLVFSFEMGF